MARILNTLPGRFVLAALAVELLVAPLLFESVLRIVRNSEIQLFVNDVRAYSRFLADMLEFELPRASEKNLVNLLDSIVLSHETVYAELRGQTTRLSSSLLSDNAPEYVEDFAFGEHDDDVYFLSIPLNGSGDEEFVLRLGFDEQQIDEALASARAQVLWSLSSVVLLSILLAMFFGVMLIKPLRDIRRESRAVASGKLDEHFDVDTHLAEIRDLASDLEFMRDKLVRANQQLVTEIAERREAEEARASLEHKLRHVQKVEMIGTLAGGIAHEFNNLLVPIKLYTELVSDELPADSPSRDDLKRVLAAVTRAKSLVQKILTFSRQSQMDQYTSMELGPVLDDVLTLARDLYPATIAIQTDLQARDVRIVGDDTQLHQLIMNLLNNAYQAIDSQQGTITVEMKSRTLTQSDIPPRTNLAPGEYVVVSVRDTGHGLDSVGRERIFEPFYTTRRPGEGTGLGLSVAHGIASSHGGDIAVESGLGRGSTFSLYLPVVDDEPGRLTDVGPANILYVAAAGAPTAHRVAASAIGARIRTVAGRTELLQLLTLEADADLLILDFGVGDFGEKLEPQDLPRRRATDARVLVLGSVGPLWDSALRSWPHARQLLEPVDAATISAVVHAMLAERPARTEENGYDARAGDRRRAGRV